MIGAGGTDPSLHPRQPIIEMMYRLIATKNTSPQTPPQMIAIFLACLAQYFFTAVIVFWNCFFTSFFVIEVSIVTKNRPVDDRAIF